MCYSPQASFSASAVLTAIGAVTVGKHHKKRRILLAVFPLLCALQQFAEGILWLNISFDNLWARLSKYVFLFFALILWPVWTSASLLPLEEDKIRRKTLYALMLAGFSVSMYLLYWAVKLGGVPAEAFDNHIAYSFVYPYKSIVRWVYLVCIAAPYFVTRLRKAWILGALFGLSFIYTSGWAAKENFISIWCFWATVSSISVYFILSQLPRRNHD